MRDLLQQLDEVRQLVVLKHQAGRHDQQTHTPKKYGAGTSVTYEWFHNGGSSLVSDLDPAYADVVIFSLVDYGVSREDLSELGGFTIEAPRGYATFTAEELGADPREYGYGGTIWRDDGSESLNGVYVPYTRTIHISESILAGPSAHKTILHEVGHHVSMREDAGKSSRWRQSSRVLNELERTTGGDSDKLASYGMRRYSLTKGLELMADSYMVDKAGSDVQKNNFERLLGDMGVDSIEDVYKEFQTGEVRISVKEIGGIQNGGVIEFVTFDAVLSMNVVNSTPWYYEL